MDLIAFYDLTSGVMKPIGQSVVSLVEFAQRNHAQYGYWFDVPAAVGLIKLLHTLHRIRWWFIDSCSPFFDQRMASMAVVASEVSMELERFGVRINGRVDEVRLMENGDWLVGDIKTPLTHRITQEDIAELSLNRHLVARLNSDAKVRKNGYIRLVDDQTGGEKFVAVKLHDDAWFDELIQEYARVERDHIRCIGDVETCMNCSYADSCYPSVLPTPGDAEVHAAGDDDGEFFAARHVRASRWFVGDGLGTRHWDER